jgi:hypothetical protein
MNHISKPVVTGLSVFLGLFFILAVASPAFSGGSPPKEHHYFHSKGENWVLASGYYAIGTITYDGETLMNRQKLTHRGGFGGRTTGKRGEKKKLTVKIELYKNDNTHVITKEWSGNLGGSGSGLTWRYTPPGASYWVLDCGFRFRIEGKTSNGSVDVLVY